MRNPVEFYTKHLKLQPHPEGGYFVESFRSPGMIPAIEMDAALPGTRNFSTAIYYLLGPGDKSKFHKIRQEEVWHFYKGSCSLDIIMLQQGIAKHFYLGSDLDKGEKFQVVVPANVWFAAIPSDPNGYVLSGCTVAPGFDFKNFTMANREELLTEFPTYHELITKLT